MFSTKKKSPTVKIPAATLKKEATKVAKKMLQQEKQKEKKALLRAKAKEKAKKNMAKGKAKKEAWDDYYDPHMRGDFLGSGFVFLGIMLLALYFSLAPFSVMVTDSFFRAGFGAIMWLLPVMAIVGGFWLILQKQVLVLPYRIAAGVGFFISICALVNLLVPHNDGLALSHLYGGAIGFAFTFFVREFFGDAVAWVFFLSTFWMTASLFFGIKVSDILAFFNREKSEEQTSGEVFTEKNLMTGKEAKKILEKTKAEIKEQKQGRFENDLQIVDSSKAMENNASKKEEKTNINLEKKSEADELSEAKNKKFASWDPPSLELLKPQKSTVVVNEKKLREKAESIREKLEQFGIEVMMKSVHVGPTVTQFTLEPAAGVKLSKINGLKADLTLALAAENLRIEAPIRGKKLVGIEIPNEKRAIVGMREILESEAWVEDDRPLKLALGRDVSGKPKVADLAKMPHLLIAGKTGSGKSVAMNAFLVSLLWQNSPENLRLILVDPKRVELAPYNNLPHLLTPVIVEPEKSVSALAWAVAEMNRRYKDFSRKSCRNIEEHNTKFPEEKEPFIVIVIDELADLMMVAGKDVEAAICRIAQMARAVGMHLVIATQRPSVDVVTGLIKANLPARMAFKVSSGVDSRTIIDGIGAEDLLGFGDMLNLDGNSGELSRIQGLYVSTEEVERITNHIKLQFPENFGQDEMKDKGDEITSQSIEGMAKGGVLTAGVSSDGADDDVDEKYHEAVQLVRETGKASASFLQRQLEMGYARAARVLDQMEERGIIGPARGAKPREVYGRD